MYLFDDHKSSIECVTNESNVRGGCELGQLNTLFKSVQIRNNVLINCVGVAPMTRISATSEGLATDQMARLTMPLSLVGALV